MLGMTFLLFKHCQQGLKLVEKRKVAIPGCKTSHLPKPPAIRIVGMRMLRSGLTYQAPENFLSNFFVKIGYVTHITP